MSAFLELQKTKHKNQNGNSFNFQLDYNPLLSSSITLFENLTVKTISIKYLLGRRKRQIIYGEVIPEFPMVISLAEEGCCVSVLQYTADRNLAQSILKTDLTNA